MAEKRTPKGKRGGIQKAPDAADTRRVRQMFENKAGRYELERIEGNMAYYSFTNHQGHRTGAAMPVQTWRRMQERVVIGPNPAGRAAEQGHDAERYCA